MICRATENHDVDAYVKKLRPLLRKIVQVLREIIREAAPEAEEVMMWNRPWYRQNGRVCYISAATNHVTFGFAQGVHLADPKGLLEGTGKGMRHVKIRSVTEIRKETLRGWVKEAIQLNQ